MAASWKCFEDQSDMPLCLIQPLSLGEGGGGYGVGKRSGFQ